VVGVVAAGVELLEGSAGVVLSLPLGVVVALPASPLLSPLPELVALPEPVLSLGVVVLSLLAAGAAVVALVLLPEPLSASTTAAGCTITINVTMKMAR
jgi:hypothetical protein